MDTFEDLDRESLMSMIRTMRLERAGYLQRMDSGERQAEYWRTLYIDDVCPSEEAINALDEEARSQQRPYG
jgi:hypothetical protein